MNKEKEKKMIETLKKRLDLFAQLWLLDRCGILDKILEIVKEVEKKKKVRGRD